MTRLPKTPVQTAADQRKAQLLRYLIRQSEQRRVMFLRSLSNRTLSYELQQQLAEERGQHHEPGKPERETEL